MLFLLLLSATLCQGIEWWVWLLDFRTKKFSISTTSPSRYSLVWGVTQTTTTTTVLKTTTQCWSRWWLNTTMAAMVTWIFVRCWSFFCISFSSTTLTVCKKKKRKRAIEEQVTQRPCFFIHYSKSQSSNFFFQPPLIVARARQLPVFPLEDNNPKIEEATLDGEVK